MRFGSYRFLYCVRKPILLSLYYDIFVLFCTVPVTLFGHRVDALIFYGDEADLLNSMIK